MTKTAPALRIGQTLALTPQLQQSLRLLQLSTPDLLNEIEQVLAENPFLDVVEPAPETIPSPLAEATEAEGFAASVGADTMDPADAGATLDWGRPTQPADSWADRDNTLPGGEGSAWDAASAAPAAPDRDLVDSRATHQSLADHLHLQANALRIGAEDAAALHFLIDALNDEGYLEDSLAELAATLVDDDDDLETMRMLIRRLGDALELLHGLDPTGVGARDLAECLALQLEERVDDPGVDVAEQSIAATALALCRLDDAAGLLARGDVAELASLTDAAEPLVRAALALIARLEPQPGRRFAEVAGNVVVPDVIVSRDRAGGMGLSVELNSGVFPTLRVHEAYAPALRSDSGAQRDALLQRLQEARGFARGVEQRFDTVLRVARAIVAHQRQFFLQGERALRPLAQRELAAELGLHESTISRASAGKYMATPRGTYELRYFFASALAVEGDRAVSSAAVRALIRELVTAEDPARPLTDAQMADALSARGIHCARRTVAKYREALGIAAVRMRQAPARP